MRSLLALLACGSVVSHAQMFGPPDESLYTQPARVQRIADEDREGIDFDLQRQGVRRAAEPAVRRVDQGDQVHAYVDKSTQEVQIWVINQQTRKEVRIQLDESIGEHLVSTGGTLKVPNPRRGIDGRPLREARPYCGNTGNYDLYIRATPSNMIRDYKSGLYTDDETGEGVEMPYAIRIRGGVFFHAALPGKVRDLGVAVSGDCVRLHPNTARLLWDLTETHGGLHAHVYGEKNIVYRSRGRSPQPLACVNYDGRDLEVNLATGRIRRDPIGNQVGVQIFQPQPELVQSMPVHGRARLGQSAVASARPRANPVVREAAPQVAAPSVTSTPPASSGSVARAAEPRRASGGTRAEFLFGPMDDEDNVAAAPAPTRPTAARPSATTGAPSATAGAPVPTTGAPVPTAGAPVATARPGQPMTLRPPADVPVRQPVIVRPQPQQDPVTRTFRAIGDGIGSLFGL